MCFVILTGPLQHTRTQQGAVQSDAGEGALAPEGGMWKSGCVYQGEGDTLENPAEESGT